MDDKAQYQQWRDKLLQAVANICKDCNDPRKEMFTVNIYAPLSNTCRCHRVEEILAKAEEIDADIK